MTPTEYALASTVRAAIQENLKGTSKEDHLSFPTSCDAFFPNIPTLQQHLNLVNFIRTTLGECGFPVLSVNRTKMSMYVHHFIEIEGIALVTGVAKRGGYCVTFESIDQMNKEIAATVVRDKQGQLTTAFKKQALAKLTPEERRALGF